MKLRAIWLSMIFSRSRRRSHGFGQARQAAVGNLNGISSFSGEKCAFFIIIPVGQQQELNFKLAEGESRFGITLLSVNVAANSVEIDNRGTKQTLHICSDARRITHGGSLDDQPAAGHVGGNVKGGEEAGVGNTGSSGRTDGSDGGLNPGGLAAGSPPAGASGDNNGSGNNVTGGDVEMAAPMPHPIKVPKRTGAIQPRL